MFTVWGRPGHGEPKVRLPPKNEPALAGKTREAMHPVAQRPPIHPADLGCRSSIHPVPDRGLPASDSIRWL